MYIYIYIHIYYCLVLEGPLSPGGLAPEPGGPRFDMG